LASFGKRLVPQIPLWSNSIGRPRKIKRTETQNPSVIYFSSCISRMMGGETIELFRRVCEKADLKVAMLSETNGSCCGQIFSSKGFKEAYGFTANRTIEKLWKDSNEGKIPIVLDVTSCTQSLKSSRPTLSDENQARFDKLTILDVIDFAADVVLPNLEITKPKEKIVFHPVCSATKLGLLPKLQKIGKACARQADIPVFAACCGMAGDRGFFYPELTAAATKREVEEVNQTTYDGYYSSGKTCEIALSEASGHNYESILKLLDKVSEG
jgi:D-lactate dehydrogenase